MDHPGALSACSERPVGSELASGTREASEAEQSEPNASLRAVLLRVAIGYSKLQL